MAMLVVIARVVTVVAVMVVVATEVVVIGPSGALLVLNGDVLSSLPMNSNKL